MGGAGTKVQQMPNCAHRPTNSTTLSPAIFALFLTRIENCRASHSIFFEFEIIRAKKNSLPILEAVILKVVHFDDFDHIRFIS